MEDLPHDPPVAPTNDARRPKWRRRFAISLVALFVLAGVSIVVANYLRPQTYTSEAWLMISKRQVLLLPSPFDDDHEQFVKNQFEIIRSPRLLKPLAASSALVETPELAGEGDIPAALARQLKIRQAGQSDLYIVSFTSVSPEKAEVVVKAVVDSYLQFHQQQQGHQGNQIIVLLKAVADARHREIAQLRHQLRDKSIAATGKDPFVPQTQSESDQSELFLRELQVQVVKQLVEQELLAAQILVAEARQTGAGDNGETNEEELQALKDKQAVIAAQVKALQKNIQSVLTARKQFTGDTTDLELLRSKLASVTAVHDALNNRILAVITEQKAPSRVALFKEADRPVEPDPRRWEFWRGR
jgi:hypothetical protein